MHYNARHAMPTEPAKRSIKSRVIGMGVAGAATIAGGIATASSARADGATWDRLAQCESGGNWSINTGNGFYGGLQFTRQTWLGYGGGAYAPTANLASRDAQIAIAQKVLEGQGPGAWPVCSQRAGLTRATGGASGGAAAPAAQVSRDVVRQVPAKAAAAPKAHVHKAPVVHEAPAVTAPVTAGLAVAAGQAFTVKAGDTLSGLAETYKVQGGWQKLFEANKSVVNDPNLIFVGQELRLPA